MRRLSYKDLAVLFLFLQIIVIVRNTSSDFFSFFWFCDFAPALLGIAFLAQSPQAVKGIINVGFFGQLGYMVIIFAKMFFDVSLFGFIFDFPFTAKFLIPSLFIHAGTLIAFAATYKEKPSPKALLYSLILLVGVYGIVIYSVTPDGTFYRNYNYIFQSGLFSAFPYYTQSWVLLAFLLVVIPTYGFQYLAWKIHTTRAARVAQTPTTDYDKIG